MPWQDVSGNVSDYHMTEHKIGFNLQPDKTELEKNKNDATTRTIRWKNETDNCAIFDHH